MEFGIIICRTALILEGKGRFIKSQAFHSAIISKRGPANKMSRNDMRQMDKGLMGFMNSMMSKMDGMKMTGDFDLDFAMMIEYHQGAIDMSEAELKSGTNEKLKVMAQNIITNQKEEQSKLKNIVKNNQPMKMDIGQRDGLNKKMNKMKANMEEMKMSGNTDKNFITMMISHHESVIKMAKAELANGMNSTLNQMAKNIINGQTKEINEFKKM